MFSPVNSKLKSLSKSDKARVRNHSDSEVDEVGDDEREKAGIEEDLQEATRHGYAEMGRLTADMLRSSMEDRPEGDVTSDEHLFFQPIPSLSNGKFKRPMSSGDRKGKSKTRGARTDEFRREYSRDHPLAGGRGRYDEETSGGYKHPVGWVDYGDLERVKTPRNIMGVAPGSKEYEKVVMHVCGDMHRYNNGSNSNGSGDAMTTGSSRNRVAPMDLLQREIDEVRRQQNQALLDLLEQERVAEEDRGKMGKLVKDSDERHK
jgi:hypothetical protein